MAQNSLVSANLAAGFLESFFYGLFFLLFCTSTYLTVQRHRRLNVGSRSTLSTASLLRNPLFVIAIVLFILITAHWILVVYGSFMAFIYYEGGTSPSDFYANLATPSQIGRTTIFALTLLIADGVFLYRLWVIWERNKYVMIFPLCCFLVSLACGFASVGLENSGTYAFDKGISPWITGSSVGTLCTNVSTCGLIVWKLWRVDSVSQTHFGGPTRGTGNARTLKWTMSLLIESAALYVGWTIFYVATYEAGSNLEFPVSDAWLPITGIAFMLINVRVGLGYTALQSTVDEEPSHERSVIRWGRMTSSETDGGTSMNTSGADTRRYVEATETDMEATKEVGLQTRDEKGAEEVVLEVRENMSPV